MKYRYHWIFKLLALVLAAVSGAVLMLGFAGLVLDDLGYYERSRRSQQYRDVDNYCAQAADAVLDHFAWKDTSIEPKLFERFFRWGADVDAVDSLEYDFGYTIRDAQSGQILDGSTVGQDWEWGYGRNYDVRRGFVTVMPKAAYYPDYAEFVVNTGSYLTLDGQPLPGLGEEVTGIEYYVVSDDKAVNPQNIAMDSYHHANAGGADYTIYRMEYTGYDSYYVEVYMSAEQMAAMLDQPIEKEFLPTFLSSCHDWLLPMVIWGSVVLLLSLLWLALAAGGSPHREGIKPEGLNRIPLDLYLCACMGGAVLVFLAAGGILELLAFNGGWGNYEGALIENFFWHTAALALVGAGAGGLAAMFTMACAAQMKVGDNYWLRHSCVGTCWRYGRKYGDKLVKGCRRLISRTVRFFRQLVTLLPLTWQWLIASGMLWLLMFLCMILGLNEGSVPILLFGVLVTVLAVLYGAWCFGKLREAAKKMSGGNLNAKLENKYLLGCFGEFAGHLNTLGDACMEAADQRMRSERMKTELITNVSHDIKTPLTSIINYVDLLQKPHTDEEQAQYLEVLDRQSQQLKKLINDLMDMSKASTGNMSVEITTVDAIESVNQALGEFADKLDKAGLIPVFRHSEDRAPMLADGKLVWRVMSNLLSNAVKYALPGTRLYIDLMVMEGKVVISMKNISREELNIDADELMERFVRGDDSRNTEGSGLGLNIAKSLMELQKGQLQLLVDGDLFKVTLIFPGA